MDKLEDCMCPNCGKSIISSVIKVVGDDIHHANNRHNRCIYCSRWFWITQTSDSQFHTVMACGK